MSYTTLYAAGDDGFLFTLEEYRNSSLSAAILWGHLLIKYGVCGRNDYTMNYADALWEKLEPAGLFEAHEWWVLRTTYDRNVLPARHAETVAEAMRKIHKEIAETYPTYLPSTFERQAADLTLHKGVYQFFAWNQTSVATTWGSEPTDVTPEEPDGLRGSNLLLDGGWDLIRDYRDVVVYHEAPLSSW